MSKSRIMFLLAGLATFVEAKSSQGLMSIRYYPSKRFVVVEMRDKGTAEKDRSASEIYDYLVKSTLGGKVPANGNVEVGGVRCRPVETTPASPKFCEFGLSTVNGAVEAKYPPELPYIKLPEAAENEKFLVRDLDGEEAARGRAVIVQSPVSDILHRALVDAGNSPRTKIEVSLRAETGKISSVGESIACWSHKNYLHAVCRFDIGEKGLRKDAYTIDPAAMVND